MFGALLSVVGEAGRREFGKEEDLVKMLAAIAEKVKAAKDKEVSRGDIKRFVIFLSETPKMSNLEF